ncbi:MAG: DUF368 domain-containing protein [Clostridia bacterium]|nr:DUF368 domain-containing protein [Clostridia bacterium]
MNYLKEILRGVFIGVANIIPGVSGGTIALSMGVYEKIIGAVNNLRKDFVGSIKTLLPYGIGAVLGIVCLSFVIEFCLEKFTIPTLFAFIGLIIGGLPAIYKRVKGEKIKWTHVISFILLASVIIVPTIITAGMTDSVRTVEFGIVSVMIMIGLGMIAAASMVVPGVSGSMMLMMLGYYETIIESVNTFITAILTLDFAAALSMVGILLPFGIGVLAGIGIAAKIIEKLLKRYPNATMWGIIALVVTSPFAILYGVDFSGITVATVIVSIITFALGTVGAIKLSGKE